MIDVNPHHLETVTRILAGHVPECEVRAFGSRVAWTAKDYSDLDLAVVGERALDLDALRRLKEAFEESDLPFRVDVLDWHAISSTFRKVIEKKYEVVQKGKQKSLGMAGEWTVRPLEDCMAALIDYRGKTPEKTSSGIPLITAKVVKGGRIETPGEFIAADDYEPWMRRGIPKAGDVVITTEAPLGEVAQLGGERVALAQRLIALRGKPELLDNGFLKFLMQSEDVQDQLRARASGTTVLGIKQSELRKVLLTLPPIDEQRAIAHILGTLDDKIELNRRMNETLEAMARALFQSWFVDFDPVHAKAEGRDPDLPQPLADLFPDSFEDSELGEIPRGWQVGKLADFAALNPESWSKESWPATIQYVDLSNTKWGRIESVTTYARDDAPSRAQRVLRPGDTIVGTVRPGNGSYAFVADEGLTGSTGFAALRPQRPEYREFVYLATTTADNIEALAHLADGGAYPAVRPEVVTRTQALRAPAAVVAAFSNAAAPLLGRMGASVSESRTLAALRDTLLPKLISGELRVNDAERFIEAAT
ncbi:MAG: restriction endonuclease subunit S [Chloroflexota bacterium]